MDASEFIRSTRFRDDEAHRAIRRAGLVYGILYNLFFALAIWGPDGLALSRSHAELAWGKMTAGLPAVLVIGAVGGYLSGRAGRAGIWIGIWTLCGALMGIIAGAAPFTGNNLVSWLAEPLVRWIMIYPMGPAGSARMWFFTTVHAALGAGVGLLGHWVTERAWSIGPGTGRLGWRAAAVLLWCLPLAIGAGAAGNDLINRDLRIGPVVVHALIANEHGDEGSHADLEALRQRFSRDYTLHLTQYDLDGQYSSTVDVAFDNGFGVRCKVFGSSVAGCPDISTQFATWMDAIVKEALEGNPGTILGQYGNRLTADPAILAQLTTQVGRMSDEYTIRQAAQRGGTIVMAAEFATPHILTCYFHGDAPVVLDSCQIR